MVGIGSVRDRTASHRRTVLRLRDRGKLHGRRAHDIESFHSGALPGSVRNGLADSRAQLDSSDHAQHESLEGFAYRGLQRWISGCASSPIRLTNDRLPWDCLMAL